MSTPSIDPAAIELGETMTIDLAAYMPDPLAEPTA